MDDSLRSAAGDDRLYTTLLSILRIAAPELPASLEQACSLVNEVLGADKVDVFLYEAATQSLVAMGTSQTPMGRKQHELGLNRQPLANNGPAARVFRDGQPQCIDHADDEPDQIPGVLNELGVRSELDVPLVVNGVLRGVLQADSSEPARFSERDLQFLSAVADWIGLMTHRAEVVEDLAQRAEQKGRQASADELAQLTRRQQEIAACVAEGLTNEEIAARLVLVPGTVGNHMEQALRRLNLRNRTQLAVWAVDHGLYRPGMTVDDDGL
jgi:two-component system, OmpR family, sensor kinase